MKEKKQFNIIDELIGNTDKPKKIDITNISDDNLKRFKDFFQQQTLDQMDGKKYYAVMCFYTEYDLGISNETNKWINTINTYYKDGRRALDYYANTPCPASQLIDANTIEELLQKMNEMLNNFNDEKFLDELREYL